MATSYSNTGGSGNRTSIITPSTVGFSTTGPISNAVDGAFGNSTTDSWFAFIGSVSSSHAIRFDFGTPKIIDEAKWYSNSATNQGTWKWQGSADASSWTDIGSSFTLGGATPFQTQTQLNGNTTAYRYYQLLGVSGTFNSGPWEQEIEFKIDDPFTLPTVTFDDASLLTVVWFPPLFAEFFDEAEFIALPFIPLELTATFEDDATSEFLLEGFSMELVKFYDEAEMIVVVDIPDPVPLPIQMITIITGR